MGRLKAKIENFRFKGTLAIVLVFALIATILLVELSGIQFQSSQNKLELLSKEQIVTKTAAYNSLKKDVLLLYSSADPASASAYEQFALILTDMKWGARMVDLSAEAIPAF